MEYKRVHLGRAERRTHSEPKGRFIERCGEPRKKSIWEAAEVETQARFSAQLHCMQLRVRLD